MIFRVGDVVEHIQDISGIAGPPPYKIIRIETAQLAAQGPRIFIKYNKDNLGGEGFSYTRELRLIRAKRCNYPKDEL